MILFTLGLLCGAIIGVLVLALIQINRGEL